jgi:hypothetical protein
VLSCSLKSLTYNKKQTAMVTIREAETGEVIELTRQQLDSLLDADLVFYDGTEYRFNDCFALRDFFAKEKKDLEIEIKGGGTRDEVATALRLIADALDGTGRNSKQLIVDMDGAGWNDMAVITTFK